VLGSAPAAMVLGLALQVGEIGGQAAVAGCRRAADGVAKDAGALGEHLLAVPFGVRGGLARAFGLLGAPSVELCARLHDREHLHMGVLDAAELGAASVPFAGLGRGDPDDIAPARDDVALVGNVGDPKGVDHVRGGEADLDRLVQSCLRVLSALGTAADSKRIIQRQSGSAYPTGAASRAIAPRGWRAR
jgi:hypothetical protein